MAREDGLPPGTLVMLILRVLASRPMHGYAISQRIAQLSNEELSVEEGSLYPALQKLLLCDPSREVLEAYGAYGEKQLYGKQVTGVIRSTLVIDEDGTVEQAQYNVKASGHVAKLRKDLGLD